MRKIKICVLSIILSLFVTSCSPSRRSESISFINGTNSFFYTFKDKSKELSKLKNYDAFNSADDINNDYACVGVYFDVKAQKEYITVDLLNDVYDKVLKTNVFGYIFFSYFDTDLSVIAGSQFENILPNYKSINSNTVAFYNNGNNHMAAEQRYSYSNVTGSDESISILAENFITYSTLVKTYLGAQ